MVPVPVFRAIRMLVRHRRLKKSFLYDMEHYFKHSMNVDNNEENKLISRIILDSHVVEKGLTMPETKIGFGVQRSAILMKNMIRYINCYNAENVQLLHGFSVLKEYFDLHEGESYKLDDEIVGLYDFLLLLKKNKEISYVSREQVSVDSMRYFHDVESSFPAFSSSRSSIRNFSDTDVCHKTLLATLDLARNTPSACNRQSVRVHLYREPNKIKEILKLQGGNRGFGHLANFLIAVTFKSKLFFEQNERNSGYVDGGMYCMNILYSLHAKKIAACILNAAHTPEKDVAMRAIADIPDDEVFVAFIVGGNAPEQMKIARSFRYPLEYVLTKHGCD